MHQDECPRVSIGNLVTGYGVSDAGELRELLNDVEELLRSGQPLEKGGLSKYLGVLQRNAWIAGPVASTLMYYAVQAALRISGR